MRAAFLAAPVGIDKAESIEARQYGGLAIWLARSAIRRAHLRKQWMQSKYRYSY